MMKIFITTNMQLHKKSLSKLKILLFIITSFLSFPLFAQYQLNSLTEEINLLAQRARLMKEVAAYKWVYAPQHHAIAYRAKQERTVLMRAYNIAKAHQLNPLSIMVFTQVQMDLSKQIETYWFNQWSNLKIPSKNKPTKNKAKNLNQLRKKIENIDRAFYVKLHENIDNIKNCSTKRLSSIFDSAFSHIAGIPTKPTYIGMFVQSFKAITIKN